MTDAIAEPTHAAYGMAYKPTLLHRINRLLGFRTERGEDPEGVEAFEGWARTDLRFKFTALGRIKLLFSGKLKIELTHYANLPIDTMKNRVDVRFLAPWERD